jgi:hypothetical protein
VRAAGMPVDNNDIRQMKLSIAIKEGVNHVFSDGKNFKPARKMKIDGRVD